MLWYTGPAVILVALLAAGQVRHGRSYVVGAGLNVRFGQLLPTDSKYQVLREQMIKKNTKALVFHCRADVTECETALAKMKYKASKHFYALAKAVVAYVKSESTARPSGYVGTAMFCHENTCIPDMDPPIVYGGCAELIGCGGNRTWALARARPDRETSPDDQRRRVF